MSEWEPCKGASDDWFTPPHIFAALSVSFDMDVASPDGGPRHVPCASWITEEQNGLVAKWSGFVWMNPPFGGRNGLVPWLERFFDHGNGVALTPDRTSAPWWQDAAERADAMLLTRGKVKFERPDGTLGKSPGSGVTLWASGAKACLALARAEKALGSLWVRNRAVTL